MKILPFEKYTLVSPLKPEEAIKKLETVVPTSRGTFTAYDKGNKPYKGKISGTSFEILRIIGYRNSFQPVIKGTISGYSGSEITICMRMHKAVIVFCGIWITVVLLMALGTLIAQLHAGGVTASGMLPFAMLVLMYSLVIGGFK